MHVVSVFTIGSPKPALQKMAIKVYKVANSLGLKLYFHWKSREDPTMVLVDKGSRGSGQTLVTSLWMIPPSQLLSPGKSIWMVLLPTTIQ